MLLHMANPCSHKRDTGLILPVLFETATTSQPLPPTEQWWKVPPPQLKPLISATTSHRYVFFGLLHVFFLSYRLLLNNYILLNYVTTHDHPLLVQTWHGVGFVCFICTQDSRHVTATATRQAMTKGTAITTPTTHINYNISSVYFLFGLLHLICFTEQLYF